MRWLALLLAGPMLWAFGFVLIYGLHGIVCADVTGPEGLTSATQIILIGVWVMSMLAFIPLFIRLPKGPGLHTRLPRVAAWSGLVATAFTLFPVALATSC